MKVAVLSGLIVHVNRGHILFVPIPKSTNAFCVRQNYWDFSLPTKRKSNSIELIIQIVFETAFCIGKIWPSLKNG